MIRLIIIVGIVLIIYSVDFSEWFMQEDEEAFLYSEGEENENEIVAEEMPIKDEQEENKVIEEKKELYQDTDDLDEFLNIDSIVKDIKVDDKVMYEETNDDVDEFLDIDSLVESLME